MFYRRVTGAPRFQHYSPHHHCFVSRVILFQMSLKKFCHKFSALKTCFNADTRSQPAPNHSYRSISIPPPGGQSTSSSCWRLTSPLPTQRSSSIPPAGSQSHPSPPSGPLPPLLLAVKFTPPSSHPPLMLSVKLTSQCPAFILHPCLRSNSPLSAQRSFSTPAGGPTVTPPHTAVILHPCWGSNSNGSREMW